jgi:hypothetical protein
VLTDVTLKGELSGRDVVQRVRVDFGYGKRRLPVLVMTGDGNRTTSPGCCSRRQRPGTQADRRTPAHHQGAVPAAPGAAERWPREVVQ